MLAPHFAGTSYEFRPSSYWGDGEAEVEIFNSQNEESAHFQLCVPTATPDEVFRLVSKGVVELHGDWSRYLALDLSAVASHTRRQLGLTDEQAARLFWEMLGREVMASDPWTNEELAVLEEAIDVEEDRATALLASMVSPTGHAAVDDRLASGASSVRQILVSAVAANVKSGHRGAAALLDGATISAAIEAANSNPTATSDPVSGSAPE
ncbi:hypothetical protein ASF30_01795 [Leifsonia sp. Leaf264]|nr:hypothetical protein ASF30_01795 [Leifsonia sp. Leaf264]